MRRMAGVALAAMVTCGWAGGVEASPVDIVVTAQIIGPNENVVGIDIQYSDTKPNTGNLYVSYNLGYTNSGEYDGRNLYTFIGLASVFLSHQHDCNALYATCTISASAYSDAVFTDIFGTEHNGISISFDFYTTSQAFDPPRYLPNSSVEGETGNVNVDGQTGNLIGISVTGDISPVSLPGSLPLFGAALIALGGASVLYRRNAHLKPRSLR